VLKPPSMWVRGIRFFREWPVIPGLIIAGMILMSVLAPVLAPHDPSKPNLRLRNAPPGWYKQGDWTHPLGTDYIGRDVLSRVLYGARVSLLVAAVALVSGTVVGTSLGLLAGYLGGHIDEIIMRIVDIWLGLPFLLVALVIVVVVGGSIGVIIALLALLTWASFVRNVRAEVLSLKSRDYISLAKVAGASPIYIMFRHILPGVLNTVIVIASLRVGGLILTEASLSFLGAGIPPPTPAWGSMIADGREYLRDAWWVSTFPGIGIFLLVLALNFFGDWFRDHFDPRLRQV